ncbi:hypothetical protein C1646_822612 [Rhizophagus diaphanus]|nr:hypothetical protein C1646_822612 [Rhizophagus diaphanus] [Rhizophagus sp. MUCL 43196]
MSQQEKKKSITKVYKFPSKITPTSTTSKSASEINPAVTTSKSTSKITPAAITTNETTSALATTSKSTQKDLYHNLDLDDNPSLETENHKLRVIIADLCNKNTKLEKTNVDIFKELKSLKDDFSTLMEINNAFGTENEELKRKLRANKDVDDDLMDVKSNAIDELPEKPNERGARVC